MSADLHSIELAILAGQAAKRKKAKEVIALDVSKRLVLTDMFVLATGNNERQVRAIVDAIDETMTKQGVKLLRREGLQEARWVLLDYGSLVVHIQHEEDRQFYALERLWSDAPLIPVPDPDEPSPDSSAESLSDAEGDEDAKGDTEVSPLDFLAGNY